VAFIGAMTIAWSQLDNTHYPISVDSFGDILRSKWIYSIPMPIFFALSGTLVFKWFREFDESAVIGANFLISALALIPTTVIIANLANASNIKDRPETAILLLLVGTLASSAAGRVFYQVALTTTRNDNGFVTMFFLMIPGIASLICIPLSWWIPELHVVASLMFFLGLALVMIPLAVFSVKSSSGGVAELIDAPPERGDGAVGSGAVLP
jgi:hypothetical protein